jgi:hypothetical protein
MTQHYWNADPGTPPPPTWQQTPRAVPPKLGRPGPSAPPATGGSPGNSTAAAPPAPSAPPLRAPAPQPAPPPGPSARPRARSPLRKRLVRAVAARRRAAETLLVVGSLMVGGIGLWSGLTGHGPGAAGYVVPGTLQAEVLSPAQVSSLLGTTLSAGDSVAEPASAPTVVPATCAVAAGPGSQAVYTRGWTQFESITYQDSRTDASHLVTQIIGRYGDGGRATTVFRALADGVKGCSAATVTGASGAHPWTYTLGASAPDTVTWTSVQVDGDGWACYHRAALRSRSVLQVTVCQPGDGTAATAAIADAFFGKPGGS